MSLPAVVLNNKSSILKGAGILIVILALSFGVIALKDRIINSAMAERDAKIQKLEQEINQLKIAKVTASANTNAAVNNFNTANGKVNIDKPKTDTVLNTKPTKPSLPALPTISVVECSSKMDELMATYAAREEILATEIKDSREALSKAEEALSAAKAEIKVDNALIATQSTEITLTKVQITDLTKKVETEKSRKKVYRTTTLTLGGVVLLLLVL